MVKLKELWTEYKGLKDKTTQRASDLRNKINEIEKWCIDQKIPGFESVTKWNVQLEMKEIQNFKDEQEKWLEAKKNPGYYCGFCLEKLVSLDIGYEVASKTICSQCGKSPVCIEIISPYIGPET